MIIHELQVDFCLQLSFLLRLIASALCGMVIGWERENRLKSAGIRTHMVMALAECETAGIKAGRPIKAVSTGGQSQTSQFYCVGS